jgi:hypothetical protein
MELGDFPRKALVLPVGKNFDRKVVEHSSHVLISLE